MTVTVSGLKNAQPALWFTAANDARDAAHHCHDMSSLARNEVARTLQACWVDDAGKEARQLFVRHADTYEAAATALEALMSTYGALAQTIEGAQRALGEALDFARTYSLAISEAGEVTGNADTDLGKQAINDASRLVSAALTAANQADEQAASRLWVIAGLTDATNPDAVSLDLQAGADERRNPDERGGRRIDEDDRRNREPGGDGDGHFDNDWAGRAILERYLRGGDDWTITDDSDWSEYMRGNQILRDQLRSPVQTQAQHALDQYLTTGTSDGKLRRAVSGRDPDWRGHRRLRVPARDRPECRAFRLRRDHPRPAPQRWHI
ncbi:MAG: hypothetical protein ACRDTG_01895 [Pseudonocardiaceae bacterium]